MNILKIIPIILLSFGLFLLPNPLSGAQLATTTGSSGSADISLNSGTSLRCS